MERESKRELVNYRLDSAKDRLDSAEILLENGSYKDFIGRSYYADFFIVSKEDAKEQLEKAYEFYRKTENYIKEHFW